MGKLIKGRWIFSNNIPLVIDVFFNIHRKSEPVIKRSKITKDYNYKFKEVWIN